ncbi:MAG: glycosyltransferase [Oscillospiraceae bacterium]|nr:glycosyltransferase [Oscillospiraceae bacterium]
MFDFTIVIVAYHNYQDIVNAVKTVDCFTAKEISKKLYVIDNSCLEPTAPEKLAFLKKLSEYSFVEYRDTGKNLGFGGGHNYVMQELDSQLHIIMNPDILLTEDSLFQIREFMKDESIGMCVPRLTDEAGEMQLVYRREITLFDMFVRMFCKNVFKKRFAYHTMQDCDFSSPMNVPFAQGSFLVIRTALYKELGGFDERYFMYMEDADLCRRVNQVSRLVYDPYTSVIHKWEKGSHKNKRLFQIHAQSMFSYFRKWGWKFF